MENYRKLGARMRRFAEAIAEGCTAAEAVRRIRPNARHPKQQGFAWRHLPQVAAAIEELQADTKAAFAERELRHKAGIYNRANADRSLMVAAALFPDKAVLPADPREWPPELRDCIESVKFKDGVVSEITLSNRNEAARLFSQHMGWITDKHELAGAGGAPLIPAGAFTISFEDGAPGVPPVEGGTD